MDKCMKVLQISKLYYPHIGGVERVVQDIAEGLKDKVDMKVLVCQQKGKGGKEIINGVEVFRASSLGIYFSMPVSFNFPFLLKRLGKDMDILHFHMPFPLGDISYLLMKPQGKLVVWWHSDIIKQKNLLRLYKPFLIRFLRKADKIIVATPNHIESSVFLKDFRDKCEVIPFGIDIARFRLNDKMREKVESIRDKYGPKIILFIGRLIYYKGVEYMIRAMKRVDARLLIVGDGPLRDSLINLVTKLGIEDKIVFLRKIDDEEIAIYYHACDIFVLPSIANSEAFGIVQLEAMACGKPVVSTNLPTGVPFVNSHEKTGLIVPPKDSEAMAQAINRLLNNSDLREIYGQYSKQRVEKEFTKELMIRRILTVYEKLLNNQNSRKGDL